MLISIAVLLFKPVFRACKDSKKYSLKQTHWSLQLLRESNTRVLL